MCCKWHCVFLPYVPKALWIMAAKCEMEDRNSSETARNLFLRALRFHPENKKIYQEVSNGWGLPGCPCPALMGCSIKAFREQKVRS